MPAATPEQIQRWRNIVAQIDEAPVKKEWAKAHNFNLRLYYSWREKLLQIDGVTETRKVETATQFYEIEPGIAAVTEPASADFKPELMIRSGQFQVLVGGNVSERALATVMKVLGHA